MKDISTLPTAPHPGWRPKILLGCLLTGFVLLFTYYLPVTAEQVWQPLDIHAAYLFNRWVTDNSQVQYLWALAGIRKFDYYAGVFFLAIAVHYAVKGSRHDLRWRCWQVLMIVVALLLITTVTRNLIFQHPYSPSPTLILGDLVRLSDLTGLSVKDTSKTSFPGDHATMSTLTLILIWGIAGWRHGVAALLLCVVALLPRLVAGAHWLSDVVAGGIGTALLTAPWVVFTPLGDKLVALTTPFRHHRRKATGTS